MRSTSSSKPESDLSSPKQSTQDCNRGSLRKYYISLRLSLLRRCLFTNFCGLGSINRSNGASNIMSVAAYTTAETDNFMLLMAAISAFQAVFLLLPFVENWVKRIEEYVKAEERRMDYNYD